MRLGCNEVGTIEVNGFEQSVEKICNHILSAGVVCPYAMQALIKEQVMFVSLGELSNSQQIIFNALVDFVRKPDYRNLILVYPREPWSELEMIWFLLKHFAELQHAAWWKDAKCKPKYETNYTPFGKSMFRFGEDDFYAFGMTSLYRSETHPRYAPVSFLQVNYLSDFSNSDSGLNVVRSNLFYEKLRIACLNNSREVLAEHVFNTGIYMMNERDLTVRDIAALLNFEVLDRVFLDSELAQSVEELFDRYLLYLRSYNLKTTDDFGLDVSV